MKIIMLLASLLLVISLAGASTVDFTSGSSYDSRSTYQIVDDLKDSIMIMNLVVGRQAGQAEMYSKLYEIDESKLVECRQAIGKYNNRLKAKCNESRYNELKIKYPDSTPSLPGALVDEYGDYIGTGASYDSDPAFYNDTEVMYIITGREAGKAEVLGQTAKVIYEGNTTEKIDSISFGNTISQCNGAIREYNKLLKAHCDESQYHYDEFKINEFGELKDSS